MKGQYIIFIFILTLTASILTLIWIKDNYLISCGELSYPSNLENLKLNVSNIKNCYENNKISIHIMHMICFIFLQTWCIPGTIIFNLFAGAVFGLYKGFLCCLVFNTIGAYCSYLISRIFLQNLFDKYTLLSKSKSKLQSLVNNHKSDLMFYLIGLRIFPGSPNWLMNITFPHIGISSIQFCISVFIGISPWNFISCSAGEILNSLTSTKDIMTFEKYAILISLFACIVGIPYLKNKFQNKTENKIN